MKMKKLLVVDDHPGALRLFMLVHEAKDSQLVLAA